MARNYRLFFFVEKVGIISFFYFEKVKKRLSFGTVLQLIKNVFFISSLEKMLRSSLELFGSLYMFINSCFSIFREELGCNFEMIETCF